MERKKQAGVAATPEATVYLLIDADLATTAAAADRLLEPVLSGAADLTIGVLPPAEGRGGFGVVKSLAAKGVKRASGYRYNNFHLRIRVGDGRAASLLENQKIKRELLQWFCKQFPPYQISGILFRCLLLFAFGQIHDRFLVHALVVFVPFCFGQFGAAFSRGNSIFETTQFCEDKGFLAQNPEFFTPFV